MDEKMATILKFETMSKHVGEQFQQAVKLTPTPIACKSRLGKQNNAKSSNQLESISPANC
jgi:hypothetical protein